MRAEIHIARHKVHRWEVEEVLKGPGYTRGQRGRLVVIGRTMDRVLVVVLKPLRFKPGCYRVVTARDASRNEIRLLSRRGRRGP
jgi:uncharacterized DUF497 family protein